jgi:hypothetical protein
MMVEMAGGATLSLVYENILKEAVPNLTENSTVILIVCGGMSLPEHSDGRFGGERGIVDSIQRKIRAILEKK